MKPGARTRQHRFRAIHIAGAILFVGAAFLLRLASQGLPQRWVDALADAASTDRFALELEGVSVSLLRTELDVRRVRIFPKGVVHEAVLELQNAALALRWRRGEHPLACIRSIRLGRLVLPGTGLDLDGARATLFIPTTPDAPAAAGGSVRSDLALGPIPIDCAAIEAFGMAVNGVSLQASTTNGEIRLADIRVSLPSRGQYLQKLTGGLAFDLEERWMRAEAEGRIDPTRLVPLFRAIGLPGLASEFARFAFPGAPPEIRLDLDYRPDDNVRDLRVDVKTGFCTCNGVPLISATGLIRASGAKSWSALAIDPLRIHRPEGKAAGRLAFDFDQNTLAFEADSTIDPLHLLRLIRITARHVELPMDFDNPTRTTASGVFDLEAGSARTAIAGEIQSPCINAQGVPFTAATAHCRLDGEVWTLTNIAAQVCGGRVGGVASFVPDPRRHGAYAFACDGAFEGVHHAQIAPALGLELPSEDSPGSIDLAFALRGPLPPPEGTFVENLDGNGRLALKQVRLYTIPLFAGLTEYLAARIPGVDFLLSQDDFEADWRYAQGRLDLEAMRISGHVFSASGSGSVLLDGEIDFLIQGHLLSRGTWIGEGLYYALFPLSKMLEFRGTGPWKSPTWIPVGLPGDSAPDAESQHP